MRQFVCFTGTARYLDRAIPDFLDVTDLAGRRWLCFAEREAPQPTEVLEPEVPAHDCGRVPLPLHEDRAYFRDPALRWGETVERRLLTCRTKADLPKMLAEGRQIHPSFVPPPPWIHEYN